MRIVHRAAAQGCVVKGAVTLRCHFAFDTRAPQAGDQVQAGRLRAVNHLHCPPGSSYRLGSEKGVDILTWVASGELVCAPEGASPVPMGPGGLHLVNTGTGCAGLEWRAGAVAAQALQVWILPDDEDFQPPCQEARLEFPAMEDGGFHILASGFPEDDPQEVDQVSDGGPVTLRGRARLLRATIGAGEGAAYQTTPRRVLYLVVVSGRVTLNEDTLNEDTLNPGDAMLLADETSLVAMAVRESVLLLVDVAEGHGA